MPRRRTKPPAPAKEAAPAGGLLAAMKRFGFSAELFEYMAKGRKATAHLKGRLMVSDKDCPGLRVLIWPSGVVSYHCHFEIPATGSRPFVKLGEHKPGAPEHITVDQARQLTRTIRALAAKGVDPTEGLHSRLMRELLAKGEKWTP